MPKMRKNLGKAAGFSRRAVNWPGPLWFMPSLRYAPGRERNLAKKKNGGGEMNKDKPHYFCVISETLDELEAMVRDQQDAGAWRVNGPTRITTDAGIQYVQQMAEAEGERTWP